MDFQAILTAIGSVGFPIVCCIYLIYTHNKETERTSAEIEKLRVTVENNTKVMIKLCERMGVDSIEET